VGELYSRRSFLAGALTAGMLSTAASFLLTRRESITLTLATGVDDSLGGRGELITMWNELNPDTQIKPLLINSTTQDQYDKFSQSPADIFNLDVIHIPRFAAQGRIKAVDPQNDISVLPVLKRLCGVDESDREFWAVPWNADVGMLYRRVTSRNTTEGEPTLKSMLGRPPGQFVGQLDTVGSQTDEAFVINVLEHALAQDDAILDTDGVVSTNLGQWVAALSPLRAALRAKRVIAEAGEQSTVNTYERGNVRYMRNWPVYFPSVDRSERDDPGTLSVAIGRLPTGILGGQGLAVSAHSRHRSEAIRVIHFLTDTPAQKLLATYGFAPTGADAYTDADLQAARPELSLIRSAVEQSRPRPIHEGYAAFADAVKRHVHDYLYTDQDLSPQFVEDIKAALR
jgi:ABC-type glycerol-3-phosphate transport system substrate-binding protein